ncbi:MAG: hemin ABC transporter ATP-binding protein [Gammaproteobacteria bacterium]|nr:hemin ABC transporter ATP-binding protein [Gammaproteobacteria bacterium]
MSLCLEEVNYTVDKKALLKNINIRCEAGALSAIIGPNGAGKSTALKLMSGDLHPTSGTTLLNQAEISSYSTRELALHRAVMPQQTSPAFGLKVWEMVKLGRAPFAENHVLTLEHVEKSLRIVDALHLADRELMTLSGGEKQRILLAKALAQVSVEDVSVGNKKFLLLDEPTASLDLKQAQTVMRILRAAADSGIGIVLVIHDIASARRYGDVVFLLKDGGLAYAGEPKSVLTAEKIADSFDVDSETAEDSLGI